MVETPNYLAKLVSRKLLGIFKTHLVRTAGLKLNKIKLLPPKRAQSFKIRRIKIVKKALHLRNKKEAFKIIKNFKITKAKP